MSEPLYIVRDNCLGASSARMDRVSAGLLATEKTITAARDGEPVSTVRGLDRFTVERARP